MTLEAFPGEGLGREVREAGERSQSEPGGRTRLGKSRNGSLPDARSLSP